MEVRLLTTPEEHHEASLIAAVAFHTTVDDTEKWGLSSPDWGAFAEDGAMMARVINNQFDVYFDGCVVKSGGIGGVCTLPEYRYGGAVSAIMAKLLVHAYERGEVVSSLFPFNHAFYRKSGYETVCWKSAYTFAPDALRQYRFTGRAALWKPGDPIAPYLTLYNRFASGYNLALYRDETRMANHVKGDCYKDRKFCYLLYEAEKPVAYVIFQDVYHNPAAILSVKDVAWDGPEGFRAILGFLARFSADYGTVELSLPRDVELFSLIHAPDAYAIRKTTDQGFMARVVNARKALSLMRKPEGSRFVIRITDEIVAGNDGTFAVCGDDARLTDEAPDLIVSVQAFSQLALGGVSLREAVYREDVRVLGNEATLEKVFVRKPILVEDHY